MQGRLKREPHQFCVSRETKPTASVFSNKRMQLDGVLQTWCIERAFRQRTAVESMPLSLCVESEDGTPAFDPQGSLEEHWWAIADSHEA